MRNFIFVKDWRIDFRLTEHNNEIRILDLTTPNGETNYIGRTINGDAFHLLLLALNKHTSIEAIREILI